MNKKQKLAFFRRAHEAYAVLKKGVHAWQEELDERDAWDTTLKDGEGNEEKQNR